MHMFADVLDTTIDALFVTNPTNIYYLTGFAGVSPTEREAFVLVTKTSLFLFTSALYKESAQKLQTPHLIWKEIHKDNPVSTQLSHICESSHIKRLGFEDTNLTVAEYTRIQDVLEHIALIPSKDRVESQRMIKQKHEIKHIRTAAHLTDRCFTYILPMIKPGVTESFIAAEITSFFREFGAENAFSPIVAFGKNTSMPHYGLSHLSKTACQTNDIVLLDFGARVNGYCADMTRMVFVGTPKPEWIEAYTAVLTANQKAIELLKNGQRNGATLDAAAQEILAEANLPVYPHSLGHAVGLDIHEAPRLTVKKEEQLKPNMAVTIEPGTYIEGSYGIRIEDLILVQKTGVETLSRSHKELTIV